MLSLNKLSTEVTEEIIKELELFCRIKVGGLGKSIIDCKIHKALVQAEQAGIDLKTEWLRKSNDE